MIKKIKQICTNFIDLFDLCKHKFKITEIHFYKLKDKTISKTTSHCSYCNKEVRKYEDVL